MSKTAQFKELRFKSKDEFNEWLAKTAKYKIDFEDHGQDFLSWWIDKRGEVIHCEPFQSSVWNGTMVMTNSIKVGKQIVFQDGRILNYKTTKISLNP